MGILQVPVGSEARSVGVGMGITLLGNSDPGLGFLFLTGN